jgi:hypothetical protein
MNAIGITLAALLALAGQSYYARQHISGVAPKTTPTPTPTPTPTAPNKTCTLQTDTFSKGGSNVTLGYLPGDAVNSANVAAAKSLCDNSKLTFNQCYLARLTVPKDSPACNGADPCSVVFGNTGGVLTGGVPTSAGSCTAK